MKKIFIVWGSSDVGGHDLATHAQPLAHPDDVFYFAHGVFNQNPQEPVISGAGQVGSTPMRYFADAFAGDTSDDIAFMTGAKHGHTGTWHDGVDALTGSAIRETISLLAPALDAGWALGGLVLAIGPGDADTAREVQTYEHRFALAVHRLHDQFGDVPIFNMQTWMPVHPDYQPEVQHRIAALRHEMVDVARHVHGVHAVLSDPHWTGVPGHSGSSHLDVAGQVQFGHALADAVFDFWA